MAEFQPHLHAFQAIWKIPNILISPSVRLMVPMLLSALQKLMKRKSLFRGEFYSEKTLVEILPNSTAFC